MSQEGFYISLSVLSFVFSIMLAFLGLLFARKSYRSSGVEAAIYDIAYLAALMGSMWQAGEGLGLLAVHLGG